VQLTPYIALLTLGLVSSFHCIGMCGGIMGALGLSTPTEVRQSRFGLFGFVTAYNGGRVLSYASAGALLWLVESLVPDSVYLANGHLVLRLLGAAVMLGAGLHLAGWFHDFKRMEVVGRPLWRKLEPVARKLLPVKSLPQALAYGAVWGWMPCGLVYMALLYAASQSAVSNPILMMACFGLGTLPVMLATGLMIQPILRLARSRRFRQIAGLLICLMALVSVIFVPQDHSQHIQLQRDVDTLPMSSHGH
jgi:hypothetical protein